MAYFVSVSEFPKRLVSSSLGSSVQASWRGKNTRFLILFSLRQSTQSPICFRVRVFRILLWINNGHNRRCDYYGRQLRTGFQRSREENVVTSLSNGDEFIKGSDREINWRCRVEDPIDSCCLLTCDSEYVNGGEPTFCCFIESSIDCHVWYFVNLDSVRIWTICTFQKRLNTCCFPSGTSKRIAFCE
jgi:hypothetical protein